MTLLHYWCTILQPRSELRLEQMDGKAIPHDLHSPVDVTWKLQCHSMTLLPGQTRFTTGSVVQHNYKSTNRKHAMKRFTLTEATTKNSTIIHLSGQWLRVPTGISDKWGPQGSVFGPVLFDILIGDIDKGIECTLSKSAGETRLRGELANVRDGAIQRDLDKLRKWDHVNLVWFNNTRSWCCVQASPSVSTAWGEQTKDSPDEKDSGVLVSERLNMTQPCAPAAPTAKGA
ncbi:hypothetical protein DUI87_29259 [Hirundo rustica rustica]|uniref:Reverse transcriptase domain-containing protein n=1 Tax=Hirundo rustica rustica TaxID=333673 RepID=A0A3M0J0U5_HIRRU|nr:hypothetical protein DUI87_29259 [Hirundo rustica rustica]